MNRDITYDHPSLVVKAIRLLSDRANKLGMEETRDVLNELALVVATEEGKEYE